MFMGFFYINLVFPYFTSGSISIASFISATDVPVGLITYFITIYFTWSNGFVKLFLRRLKSKKLSIKNWNKANSKRSSVKPIISKAIHQCYIHLWKRLCIYW